MPFASSDILVWERLIQRGKKENNSSFGGIWTNRRVSLLGYIQWHYNVIVVIPTFVHRSLWSIMLCKKFVRQKLVA